MNSIKKVTVFITGLFFLCSCNKKEKEDLVQEVPKDGSITTSVKVEHLNDSMDLLITKHTVYKNPTVTQEFSKTDTLPSLGKISVKDEQGNDRLVQKDYNIYITVK